MTKQRVVPDGQLDDAYKTMAKIVREHGDKYLPIFKRLHEEIETRKAGADLRDIALQIAQKMRN